MFKNEAKYIMPTKEGFGRPKADSDTCLQYDAIFYDLASSCSGSEGERPRSAPLPKAPAFLPARNESVPITAHEDVALTFGSSEVMRLAIQKAAVATATVEKKS